MYDELYHVLAAQSWAASGSLAINEGEYTRAAYFTVLTGWMLERFGDTLTVARVIPIVSDSLLVVSLFLWTRSVVGRVAGWFAALFLCFSPNAIVLSQFIRPYTMHALLFFWGALGVYVLVSDHARSARSRAWILCISTVTFFGALRLQVTTLIGLLGVSAWLAITAGPEWWRGFRRLRAYRGFGIGVLLMAGAGGVVLMESGVARHLWELAWEEPLWIQDSKFYLYHGIFVKYYPAFWGLLPVAWLYAIVRKGQPALFCCSVFAVSFLLHMFFPIKGQRYIAYLMPFFFALWGMVLADIIPQLRVLASAAFERMLPGWGLAGRPVTILQWLAVGVALLFLLGSNPAFYHAGKLIVKGPGDVHPGYKVDWATAREILAPLVLAADVVVATNGLGALYFFKRYDVEFSPTHLYELRDRAEFSVDHRTGRPVISEAKSLRQLMRCYSNGLVISESWRWKNRVAGIDEESAGLLGQDAERVALPPTANLVAFVWRIADVDQDAENRSGRLSIVKGMKTGGCESLRLRVSDRPRG